MPWLRDKKSFVDQEKVKKPFRPHYPHNRRLNDGLQAKSPVMNKPNIPPTAQTKRKSKAFQFADGRPSSQSVAEADKENAAKVTESSTATTTAAVVSDRAHDTPVKSSLKLDRVERRLPPSTPAPRLPLAELLGNGNDKGRAFRQKETPEEQVLWVHAQTPGSSHPSMVTPARKRKRAQSSSPVQSQDQSALFTATTALKKGAEDTSQADPAADLWQRYAAVNEGPAIGKTQAFAHLIRDPSPQSPATVGSVGGLRRWASCGVEWPMSATKRRRVSRRSAIEVVTHADNDQLPGQGSSKVSKLLQRMKETLTKANLPDLPSSSSPLPERIGNLPVQIEIPAQPRLATVNEQEPEEQIQIQMGEAKFPNKAAVAETPRSSSDYGDDDLDTDLVEAVESTAKQVAPIIASTSHIENPFTAVQLKRAHFLNQTPQQTSILAQATVNPPTMPSAMPALKSQVNPSSQLNVTAADSDEFGDDDDDLLASVNVDQLIAEHATQHQHQLRTPTMLPQQSMQVAQGEVQVQLKEVQVISDDEFDGNDLDMDDLVAVEAAATQAYNTTGQPSDSSNPRTIQRYQVTAIHEQQYQNAYGQPQPEKVLTVDEPHTARICRIILRQSWFDTPATIGSYVHVVGEFDDSGQCIIDENFNILILHPDHLISATVVADSFTCVRRAVLQDRVKATSEASAPMMHGHIIHELFQEALKANQWDDNSLRKLTDEILPRHYETMVEIGLNLNQVHEHLRSKYAEMRAWAEVFVRAAPIRDAVIKGRNGQQAIMSINKLLDVEEHIWSPNYGLKGNVDATVQATIRDGSSSRVLTVPFELKTGKRMNEHHVAQTALYTLLASDRYDIEITEGILYYLENAHVTRVQAIRHELMHLIMKRNELACYVRERLKLPPMLPETRQRPCNNCYAQTTCFLYHKLTEDGTSKTIANKGKFEELVKYLKPVDQSFFTRWDQLLTKEESEMKKFTRELWTMQSTAREKRGRCFSKVVIEPGSAHELQTASKINRFQYTFVKQSSIPGFSFTESQINQGDPVVISDEKGHYALACGYVKHVHKKKITVAVDRRLHNARTRRPGFDSQTNQDFIGVMEAVTTQDNGGIEPVTYRVDKDEFSNGMATARNNILQIMDDTVYKAADLRAMIVQERAPRFKAPSSTVGLQSQGWQAEMNSDQKAAVEKVMSAQDYALVLGMPGTGKTTTVAQIIRALVAQGKSVLLTSYTHTAVDNILLKLRNAGFDVLRLGVLAKVHPQVQEFAILGAQQKSTLEEVNDSWFKPPVIATTCLGVSHGLFGKRTFDYCIVDEASQITLPVCLGPIRMAKTFILVGDHFQLPPLVQNKDAQEGGLDMSLFRLLSERHPEAVVNLEHQYRMCADIMYLSNTLIYNGRLKCGTELVAKQKLDAPQWESSINAHHYQGERKPASSVITPCMNITSCHLAQSLRSENKVLFFNTDTLRPLSNEIMSGPRITNPFEATLTSQFVLTLLHAGVPASEIGVITFYRSQLAELRQQLRAQPGLELHTADKFQGRDKEAVVVSFVRSNAEHNVGELLRDWRRINVAITRAKTKMILIGSKSTLTNGGEVLKGLVEECEKKGWMHNLQPGEHSFSELGATQVSGITQHSPTKPATDRMLANSPRKNVPPPPSTRRPLGKIGIAASGRSKLKVAVNAGKVNQKALFSARPVLRDVVHDVVGDEENQ